MTPGNVDRINAPTLIGATAVAAHPPTKCCTRHKKKWPVHHGRDEALRIAAPSLTTSNRTTAISADGAVVASDHEDPASCKNILKRFSTVSADLQDASVEAEVRVFARRFKVEILPENQTWRSPFAKTAEL
jgi:hypothetical protein